MTDPHSRPISTGYQVFMLVLCLYTLGALAAETAVNLKPSTSLILDYADFAVCAVFFVDFILSLWRAPDRWRYFITWGWLDLMSSIPTLDIARWGRVARVARVFQVLRGLRAAKVAASLVLQHRAQNAMLAASIVALLLIVFCSVAVLHFEAMANSNIKTAEDAMWWAFVSITTVGYGDYYPVTPAGRFIAAILMTAGVGLFGTFSGFLAAWFMAPATSEEPGVGLEAEVSALRSDIARLRELLESDQASKRQ